MLEPEIHKQWRAWAEQEIGGDSARIEAASNAAITALSEGKDQGDAIAAAYQATAAWDYYHRGQPPYEHAVAQQYQGTECQPRRKSRSISMLLFLSFALALTIWLCRHKISHATPPVGPKPPHSWVKRSLWHP